MTDFQFYLLVGLIAAGLALSLAALLRRGGGRGELEALRRDLNEELRATRTEMTAAVNGALKNYGAVQAATLKQIAELQDNRSAGPGRAVQDALAADGAQAGRRAPHHGGPPVVPAGGQCQKVGPDAGDRGRKAAKDAGGQALQELRAGERAAGAGVQGPGGDAESGGGGGGI